MNRQAPGGKRTILAKVLPLETPLVVQMFPVYACNFTCRYCVFSVDKEKRGFISDKITMEYDLFKKSIDEIAVFPSKVKVLRFVGMGEPLLHKHIAQMVNYATSQDVAERVEILTNASLLTPEMSDSLLSAGLSRLVVSLQGTSEGKYKEVCGARIDFVKFVRNLKYFFDNKGNAQVHIKIIDYALNGKDDEKRFYELFGDVCDSIGIEHAGPIFPGVDYEEILKQRDRSVTQFGLPVSEVEVCPQPFFTLQINPDGKVVPCYSIAYPKIIGDCNHQSLNEIWMGRSLQQFRRRMLDGTKQVCHTCSNCDIIKHRLFPEDVLSQDAERLKRYYDA
ncbi:MAG TPA: radical SAM protein [Syntrophales bacterium]|nr:radical SAM protein [Syntrophales bacterium]